MEICSKKEQKHKRKRGERERERTKRREEKVRGTAQESFSHEAQKTKIMPVTTYTVRTTGGRGNPPPLPTHKKQNNNTQI